MTGISDVTSDRCSKCGRDLIGPHDGDKWCPACDRGEAMPEGRRRLVPPKPIHWHEEQQDWYVWISEATQARRPASRRDLRAEVERLREALKEIADKTYATQYDEPIGAVVRFASGIHVIARAAIDPVADPPPSVITALPSVSPTTPNTTNPT